MHARTNVPEAICPSNFFEVGGINTGCVANSVDSDQTPCSAASDLGLHC